MEINGFINYRISSTALSLPVPHEPLLLFFKLGDNVIETNIE